MATALHAARALHRRRAPVAVEFYRYAGDLLGVQDTILRPSRLESGQEGTVLVVMPWQDRIDKVRYRIMWRQPGPKHQGYVEHWPFGNLPGFSVSVKHQPSDSDVTIRLEESSLPATVISSANTFLA